MSNEKRSGSIPVNSVSAWEESNHGNEKIWGPRWNPAERFQWGEEEQGSGRSPRRKAGTELSGLLPPSRRQGPKLVVDVAQLLPDHEERQVVPLTPGLKLQLVPLPGQQLPLAGPEFVNGHHVVAKSAKLRPPAVVLQFLPHELVGQYFEEVAA